MWVQNKKGTERYKMYCIHQHFVGHCMWALRKPIHLMPVQLFLSLKYFSGRLEIINFQVFVSVTVHFWLKTLPMTCLNDWDVRTNTSWVTDKLFTSLMQNNWELSKDSGLLFRICYRVKDAFLFITLGC